MSLEHPNYWLAYLSEATETGPAEITVTAPEILDRQRFTHDAQILLAVADTYHGEHPKERVVFAAALTRWLHVSRGLGWSGLNIDFYDALADLDAHAPALLIQASPLTMAIVGNAAVRLELATVGGAVTNAAAYDEPVQAAIAAALERDWPEYSRRLAVASH